MNSGTLGVRLRPVKPFTINLGGEVGRASNPLTPIAARNFHAIDGRAEYRVRTVQLSAAYRQVYNLNAPFSFTSFSSHSRQYSTNASWTPNGWFSLDAAYNKLHLNTVGGMAFFAALGSRSQLQTGYSSLYLSNIHAANLGTRFGIGKRADLYVGYSITKDTGDGRAAALTVPGITGPIDGLLGYVQTFPLTYQSPLARFSVKITPKIRWNVGWQFYGYSEKFDFFANQNYHAHTGFTSVLWAF